MTKLASSNDHVFANQPSYGGIFRSLAPGPGPQYSYMLFPIK